MPPAARHARLECCHCRGGLLFSDKVAHSRLIAPDVGCHDTGLARRAAARAACILGAGRLPPDAAGATRPDRLRTAHSA
jgi:hypothetical protein